MHNQKHSSKCMRTQVNTQKKKKEEEEEASKHTALKHWHTEKSALEALHHRKHKAIAHCKTMSDKKKYSTPKHLLTHVK